MFGDLKNNSNGYDVRSISELVDSKIVSVKKNFSKEDVIKYVDISSIDNKKNKVVGYTEYVISKAPSRAQQCLKYGDILVSTVRPNLKNVAINEYNDDSMVGSSGFCVLRCIECNNIFLYNVVLSDLFTSDMCAIVTGANYPAIHSSDIFNYKVSIPPIELQNKFAEFVKLIDKQKFVCETNAKILILWYN